MLLGDKDDNLPIAKAEDYLTYLKGAGRAPPIDVSIYPGAYHAWTVSSLGGPRFYPQYPSTRKCPYILLGSGPAHAPHRRSGKAAGAGRHADLSQGRPGLHDGLR